MWKLLLSLGVLSGFHPSAEAPPSDFRPTEHGPQTLEKLDITNKALHGEHYGGDMVFSESFKASKAGIRDTKFRWPGYPGGAVVPYVIDGSLENIRPIILRGMEYYHSCTCIRFVPRTDQKDYIKLFYGKGCWSMIGRIGNGQQDLSLGDGCDFVGIVIHELGHAIGLFHVHQRSDRGKYLDLYLNNVIEEEMHNFVASSNETELIFSKYDYNSIMHYGNYAFSKNDKELKTMVAKNRQPLLEPYEKPGFTRSDIETIQKLYQCT